MNRFFCFTLFSKYNKARIRKSFGAPMHFDPPRRAECFVLRRRSYSLTAQRSASVLDGQPRGSWSWSSRVVISGALDGRGHNCNTVVSACHRQHEVNADQSRDSIVVRLKLIQTTFHSTPQVYCRCFAC